MKRINTSAFAVFSALVILTACSKKNATTSADQGGNPTPSQVSSFPGNWVVSSYIQRTEDKTAQFSKATFTFATNGTLNILDNGKPFSGTWSYSASSVGYYGGTPTKASMTINAGANAPFNRLSKTWNIVKIDST